MCSILCYYKNSSSSGYHQPEKKQIKMAKAMKKEDRVKLRQLVNYYESNGIHVPWEKIRKSAPYKNHRVSTLRHVVKSENKYKETRENLVHESTRLREENKDLTAQLLVEKLRAISAQRALASDRRCGEIERLERDLADREREIGVLREQLALMDGKNSRERDELNERVRELEERLAVSETALSNERRERATLMETKRQVDVMCSRLQQRCEELERRATHESNENQELEAERDALKKQVETFQMNMEAMEEAQQHLLKECKNTREFYERERDELINARDNDKEIFCRRVQELEKRIADADDFTRDLLHRSDDKMRSYLDMLDWCTTIYELIETIGGTNGRDEYGMCWIFIHSLLLAYFDVYVVVPLGRLLDRVCDCHDVFWRDIQKNCNPNYNLKEIRERHDRRKAVRHEICHVYRAYEAVDFPAFLANVRRYHELLKEAEQGAEYQRSRSNVS